MTDSTTDTGNYPPKPNPMVPVNPYPRPADGSPNLPALRAVRDFIENVPNVEELDPDAVPADGVAWNQSDWRCGTGMCFAGWAGAVTGAVFPYSALDNTSTTPTQGYVPWTQKRNVVRDADGQTWHIQPYAQHILGLDPVQARYLFDGGNDLDRINAIITAIEGGISVTTVDEYDADDEDE
jgi:hypothetical protein